MGVLSKVNKSVSVLRLRVSSRSVIHCKLCALVSHRVRACLVMGGGVCVFTISDTRYYHDLVPVGSSLLPLSSSSSSEDATLNITTLFIASGISLPRCRVTDGRSRLCRVFTLSGDHSDNTFRDRESRQRKL